MAERIVDVRIAETRDGRVRVLVNGNRVLDRQRSPSVALETLAGAIDSIGDLVTLARMGRFHAWRDEVDEAHALDTFDLALGYFSGGGLDHDEALRLAGVATRSDAPE